MSIQPKKTPKSLMTVLLNFTPAKKGDDNWWGKPYAFLCRPVLELHRGGGRRDSSPERDQHPGREYCWQRRRQRSAQVNDPQVLSWAHCCTVAEQWVTCNLTYMQYKNAGFLFVFGFEAFVLLFQKHQTEPVTSSYIARPSIVLFRNYNAYVA